jgi:hypothetical protein
MTVQTLKMGKREFVVIPKSDFEKLTAQAQRQTEDDFWTEAALRAEADSRARGEKLIALADLELGLDAKSNRRRAGTQRRR